MPTQIRDGSGKGFLAKVNKDNNLLTQAVAVDLVHAAALKGDAYIIKMNFEQQVADTFELASQFMYTGSRTLIFNSMYVATLEPNTTKMKIAGGTVSAAGGALVTPANLNTSSSKSLLSAILHQNDGTNPFTAGLPGTDLIEVFIEGPQTWFLEVNDAFIIAPNVPLGMYISCDTADTLVRISVTCYEYDIEED